MFTYVHGQAIVTSGSLGWWLSKISWAFEFGYFHLLQKQLINAAWLRCGILKGLGHIDHDNDNELRFVWGVTSHWLLGCNCFAMIVEQN